ncbi:MAG: NADH-ubiquinone oxidoreductase chain F, partial [uncultured Nocardioidaceae bacterium]
GLHPRPVPQLGRRRLLHDRRLHPSGRLHRPAQGARDGAGRDHRAGQGLRAARPRRRRLPDRDEVGLHPAGHRGAGGQAALPRRQRRRVRAGHLQGHPVHAGQPARPGRGRRHRVVRHPGLLRRDLRARRDRARHPPAAAGRDRRVRRRPPRQGHRRDRLRPRRRGARRLRRVHLRRGDGAARLARGLPRPAAAAPAVPGHARAVRQPDGGEQRRVDRLGPEHRARRRRVVLLHGHREEQGLHPVLAVRPREEPRPVRGAARHHAAPAARAVRRDPRGPRAEVLDPGRLVHPAAHRRAPRRPAGLRGRRGGRLDARHQGAADLRRDDLRRPRHRALDRVLRPRVLRQVHALPRGDLLDGAGAAAPRGRYRLRGGHRHAAGHLRQHLRPVVLRAGRRGHQPHRVRRAVLPRRVRRACDEPRVPVRPARLDRLRHRRDLRM